MIRAEIIEQVKKLGVIAASKNIEACGIVTKYGAVVESINIYPEHNGAKTFQLDTTMFNHDIGYIWHTHFLDEHPGHLTYPDIRVAVSLRLPILVVHVQTEEIDYYDPLSANPYPLNPGNTSDLNFYIGWQCNAQTWGRTDCFALIRSYFLGMLNKDIGNFVRPAFDGFPAPGWTPPWKAEDYGFVLVEDIQNNDILEIALQGGRGASHIAVVIDAQQGLILHQPGFGHLSKIDRLGGYWRSRIAVDDDGNYRILRRLNAFS